MEEIRETLACVMDDFIREFSKKEYFEKPVVKCADAKDPAFAELKTIVHPTHHLPTDFLAGAKSVISYALPIRREIALRNTEPGLCSKEWADVYIEAGSLSEALNARIADFFRDRGFTAVPPKDAGMLPEVLSRWSQRHVAYIAGHGTFGLNNMLISDVGSVVRYYSVITDMPLKPDAKVIEERCLYKKSGICAKCVSRCETGALTKDGFDRFKCLEMCLQNQDIFGADVCGKCIVDLPCSFAGRRNE